MALIGCSWRTDCPNDARQFYKSAPLAKLAGEILHYHVGNASVVFSLLEPISVLLLPTGVIVCLFFPPSSSIWFFACSHSQIMINCVWCSQMTKVKRSARENAMFWLRMALFWMLLSSWSCTRIGRYHRNHSFDLYTRCSVCDAMFSDQYDYSSQVLFSSIRGLFRCQLCFHSEQFPRHPWCTVD